MDSYSKQLAASIKDDAAQNRPYDPAKMRLFVTSLFVSEGNPLSRREIEIMRMVAMGKDRGQIAKELFLNIETVKSHIKSIYHKLGVHLKADAIRIVTENRYV